MQTVINKHFHKYQSLGNTFILIDCIDVQVENLEQELASQEWSQRVVALCDQSYGVGADGLLVVFKKTNELFGSEIYNADGSYGAFSGNGARSVAHYLWDTYRLGACFTFAMGDRIVKIEIDESKSAHTGAIITTTISSGTVGSECALELNSEKFKGIEVSVGNPHLVLFENVTLDWLKKYGEWLQAYKGDGSRVNIDFVVSQQNNEYKLLVHERGAGITLACSSAAAAVTWLLYHQDKININELCKIVMLGGFVETWINDQQEIVLRSAVVHLFAGVFY